MIGQVLTDTSNDAVELPEDVEIQTARNGQSSCRADWLSIPSTSSARITAYFQEQKRRSYPKTRTDFLLAAYVLLTRETVPGRKERHG